MHLSLFGSQVKLKESKDPNPISLTVVFCSSVRLLTTKYSLNVDIFVLCSGNRSSPASGSCSLSHFLSLPFDTGSSLPFLFFLLSRPFYTGFSIFFFFLLALVV